MADIIMDCGCVSQGYRVMDDKTKVPCCVVHDCIVVKREQPNLEGRTARCAYYGQKKLRRAFANDECNHGCRGKERCECGSEPSSTKLAFFESRPNEKQDLFYCGCMGWD